MIHLHVCIGIYIYIYMYICTRKRHAPLTTVTIFNDKKKTAMSVFYVDFFFYLFILNRVREEEIY